jgi:hypothetical protein
MTFFIARSLFFPGKYHLKSLFHGGLKIETGFSVCGCICLMRISMSEMV